MCKAGATGNMVSLKKKLSIFYTYKKKDAISAQESARPYGFQDQVFKVSTFHLIIESLGFLLEKDLQGNQFSEIHLIILSHPCSQNPLQAWPRVRGVYCYFH